MTRPNYRAGDGPGVDYKCHLCGLWGHRMWRQGASSCVELTCADCSEKQERAAGHVRGDDEWPKDLPNCNIGYLVPCRADTDQTIWGHCSGDTAWWYRLRQYVDPEREAHIVRLERNQFSKETEEYGQKWLKALDEASLLRTQRNEAYRIAAVKGLPE